MRWVLLIAAAAPAVSGCASQGRVGHTGTVSAVGVEHAVLATTRPTPSAEYLFSIPTASGALTGSGDKHLTLKLVGTRDYLTRFTDRPLREAFVVPNVDFVRRFKGYFGSSEPNAVLTYTPAGARIPVSIVLTVGQPRWDAKRSTLTLPATRIRKQLDNLPGTTVHIRPPFIPNPRSFAQATLIIDDAVSGNPLELSGGGVPEALGAFLQDVFTTNIAWTPGQKVPIRLAVSYTYRLAVGPSHAMAQVPILVVASYSFDPTSDWRVQPKSFVCQVESAIAKWQSTNGPSLVDAAYSFDLTVYRADLGVRSPIYASTLRYTIPSGGVPTSAGCTGPG
ncbi:MAG: hypothetical protein M3076_19905 [Actinomycetota bacterium]|nr:hypothetical protein [Actinomycetota bacterium]